MVEAQKRQYYVTRERQSYSLAFDYDINPNHRLTLQGIYNRRHDWENRYRVTYKDLDKTGLDDEGEMQQSAQNFAGFDLPARRLSPRKDSERRATKRKFVSDFVRGALCFVRTAPCCPRRPVVSMPSCCVRSAPPVMHAAPCLPKPPPLLSKPSLLCPCRPCCSHAALRFTKAVSRSARTVPRFP